MHVRTSALALLACTSLLGCEQFALVGVLPRDAASDDDSNGDDLDAALDEDAPSDAGSTARDAGRCMRDVAVCDPIANTGCSETLSMRCAPDLAAPRLAGYCTFDGPIPDSGIECLNTVVTESCPPTTTCHEGECRTLCFCDADCGKGQCCSEPLGEYGFAVCAPC